MLVERFVFADDVGELDEHAAHVEKHGVVVVNRGGERAGDAFDEGVGFLLDELIDRAEVQVERLTIDVGLAGKRADGDLVDAFFDKEMLERFP